MRASLARTLLDVLWLLESSVWELPWKNRRHKMIQQSNRPMGHLLLISIISVYLSLVHLIQCSGEKRQSDVLHLTGLQQIVTVAPLLLQFGFDSSHFLLQLGQLSARRQVKSGSETLPINRKQMEPPIRVLVLTCWHRPVFCGFLPSRDSYRWLQISWRGAGSSGPAAGPLSHRLSSCVCAPPVEETVRSSNKFHEFKIFTHQVFVDLASPFLDAQFQPRPSWQSAPTSWPSPGPPLADSSHSRLGYPDGSSESQIQDWNKSYVLGWDKDRQHWIHPHVRMMVELNSPLLGDLILSLHLLFLKFSDIPHSNLLTELNKHLVLHLENKTFAWVFQQYNKYFTDSFLNTMISPGSSGPAGHWSPSHGTGWSSWCHWCEAQNWPTHSLTLISPAGQKKRA